MILVDTSIWIDHFRAADQQLTALLLRNEVCTHPFVIGELALGSIAQRAIVLRYMSNLPAAIVASPQEVLRFIDVHKLASSELGYVDAALLAASALTPGVALWARDKNLKATAAKCGLSPNIPLN